MARVDISVRGAGIFGLSVAWACVEAGATVELVDPAGAAAGASGGVVGALAPHVPENWNAKKQFQLESLLMAGAFWRRVEEASGLSSGYARTGRVQPLAEGGRDAAQTRAAGAATHWGDAAVWELREDAGGWDLGGTQTVFDSLSAHIHPRRACLSLAAALEARGVPVQPRARASAGATLWATGAAGLADLGIAFGQEVGRAIKGQAALVELDRAGFPQLFTQTLHIIPHLDGSVAIGSTTERDFDDPDGTDQQLDTLIGRAMAAVPELAGAPVIARWAGLRPRARSRAPMLGEWPGRAGHFIANGGFKIGFGMAPKVAEAMAALILEGRDVIPAEFRLGASLR